MKKWTVIGYHLDNNQPCVAHVVADDITEIPDLAVECIRSETEVYGEIVLVGIFRGHKREVSGWYATVEMPAEDGDIDDVDN